MGIACTTCLRLQRQHLPELILAGLVDTHRQAKATDLPTNSAQLLDAGVFA